MTERVTFVTDDGVTIVGDHYVGESGGPSALLLHMMPATRGSWRPFAEALIGNGFAHVLAIDERGHGESTAGPGGKKLDYNGFSDEEQQAKMKDVEAAVSWLEGQGAAKDRLLIVGASIGANLAIAYASANHEIPAVVALSPGHDYRGVTTADKVGALSETQGLYMAASSEDEYSFKTIRRLFALKSGSAAKELRGAGHGTTMFERDAEFMDQVIEWVMKTMKR